MSHRHYCQQELKSFSFFAKLTVACCHEQQAAQSSSIKSCCASSKKRIKVVKSCCTKRSSSCNQEKLAAKKKDCCQDKSSVAQLDLPTIFDEGFGDINAPIIWGELPSIHATVLSTETSFFYESLERYYSGCHDPPDIPLSYPYYIQYQSFLC
jgi:hypothetical protein